MFVVKRFEELINKGKVVIDANTLLQAYQYKGIVFEKVLSQLELLAQTNRLIIPSSIIDEFYRNRHDLLKTMEQSLDQTIKNCDDSFSKIKIPPTRSLIEMVPYFATSQEFKEANAAKLRIQETFEEYKTKLTLLHSKVLNLFNHDPYLDRIQNLFSKCTYRPQLLDKDILEKEAQYRLDKNIPPGYKDKSKARRAGDPYGDYVLWAHILTIKDDVLFITNDNKSDWFLNGAGGKDLDLRIELQQEFNKETGYYIKGAKSKILEEFDKYFTQIRLDVLRAIEDVSLQNAYIKYLEISKVLIKHFDTRNQFIHIKSDAIRIDNSGYIRGIEAAHAEMAYSYLIGNISEEELKESFEKSIEYLQDFWDSRFDMFVD